MSVITTEQEWEGQISSSTKWSVICDVQLTDGVQINIHILQVSYQTSLNSILKLLFSIFYELARSITDRFYWCQLKLLLPLMRTDYIMTWIMAVQILLFKVTWSPAQTSPGRWSTKLSLLKCRRGLRASRPYKHPTIQIQGDKFLPVNSWHWIPSDFCPNTIQAWRVMGHTKICWQSTPCLSNDGLSFNWGKSWNIGPWNAITCLWDFRHIMSLPGTTSSWPSFPSSQPPTWSHAPSQMPPKTCQVWMALDQKGSQIQSHRSSQRMPCQQLS